MGYDRVVREWATCGRFRFCESKLKDQNGSKITATTTKNCWIMSAVDWQYRKHGKPEVGKKDKIKLVNRQRMAGRERGP
jgi:hypothetical protein